MSAPSTSLAELAHAVKESRYVAALTGAGISTLAGIPDFRSPGQEIWTRYELERVFDIGVFRRDPSYFHRFANEALASIPTIAPGPIHTLMAAMERAGCLHHVATQNIDGLHQRAGTRALAELHGGLSTGRCLGCAYRMDAAAVDAFLHAPPTPPCPRCGGILKPDVVFYGEGLPEGVLEEAAEAAGAADLYLVLGTSLQVMPAAHLPMLALRSGARVAIITRSETHLDDAASFAIRDDLATVAKVLAEALRT